MQKLEHRAEALLGHRSGDRTDRGPDDAGGDVVKGVLAPRPGRPVNGVLDSDERHVVDTTALFVLIGSVPHTAWLKDQIPLDEHGFVITGAATGSGMFETGRVGIFAVGDVRSGSVKRVASAVGEGAIAVRLVHEHLGNGVRR